MAKDIEKKKKLVVVEEESPKAQPKEVEEEVSEVNPPQIPEEVIPEEKAKSTGLMWIVVLTALLVGALAGGFITYFSGLSKLPAALPSPTPLATEVPDATEKPSDLDRADLSVQVLNGSGTAGAAGEAKEFLEELGYTNVAVGNADSSDFAQTEIAVKKDKENYLDLVKKDLEENYTLSEKTSDLDTSSKYDIVITLGKK